MVVLVFSDLLWASGLVFVFVAVDLCSLWFFFLLWIASSGGVGVFRSVVGKWACVCVCGSGSGLVLVVVFFFFCCGLPVVVVVVPVVDGTGG